MSTPTPADLAPKPTGDANGAPSTPQSAAPETPPTAAPAKLPEDHPLVTAYARQKAENEALREKARRLDELEEASKTEEQKRAEEFAALQSKVAEYETREQIAAWKQQVSEETGVPAAALAGDSLEALQAHAEVLAPLIAKPQDANEEPKTRPVPALGNQPAGSGNVSIHEQIAAAEAAGNKALVSALKASLLGQTN